MREESASRKDNDRSSVLPSQNHYTSTISYIIASSLHPHKLRHVTLDKESRQSCINGTKYNESHPSYCKNYTFCHHKVPHKCCAESHSVSFERDKEYESSLCPHKTRDCFSNILPDPSACTSGTQVLWPDFIEIKNTTRIEPPNLDHILNEHKMSFCTADKSLSSSDVDLQNLESCAHWYEQSDENSEACQLKSFSAIPGTSTSYCCPVPEKSQTNAIVALQEKESDSSNSIGGWTDQVDDIFLKTCRCRVCHQCFVDVFSLNFHFYKEHEKTAQPTCVRCSATFVSLDTLCQHLLRHKRLVVKQTPKRTKLLNSSLISCTNKSKPVHVKQNVMNSSITKMNGEKCPHQDPETRLTFPCGACGKEYRHKKTLMAHVKLKHLGFQKKMYKCGFCLRFFSSLWQRNNHVSWSHLGRKPYACQFCGEGFVCLPTLKRHQRKIHTGERPYQCLHCGESFFEKAPLDLHKAQMHTGFFPFVCSQCGRGFVQRSYLKSHWKTHSAVPPYKCIECGKKYSKISHLKRHKITCCRKARGKAMTKGECIYMK